MLEFLKINGQKHITQRLFVRRYEQMVHDLLAAAKDLKDTTEHADAIESLFVQQKMWANVLVDWSLNTVTVSISLYGNMYTVAYEETFSF